MNLRFEQIVILGASSFDEQTRSALIPLSGKKIVYFNSADELKQSGRSSSCDALLVSLRTIVDETILETLPSLRYIGILGSSFDAIDMEACGRHSIVVRNVLEYCDFETAEFCLAQLLMLMRGVGPHLWKNEPRTLAGKHLGIVGMGAVGQQFARLALGMRMKVSYYSRHKCEVPDLRTATFVDRNELLRSSDVISLHVPVNTKALDIGDFHLIGENKILINVCMGHLYKIEDLLDWLNKSQGTVILDALSAIYHPEVRGHDRAVISNQTAFVTQESNQRRLELFVQNMLDFLKSN